MNRGVAVGNPGSADSFFDVFTELTAESGADNFFDVFTELAESPDADSFFDVFTELAQKVRTHSADIDATPNQLDEVTFTIAPNANNDAGMQAISRGDGQGQTLLNNDAVTVSEPKLAELRVRGFAIADLGVAGDGNDDGYTQIGHGG